MQLHADLEHPLRDGIGVDLDAWDGLATAAAAVVVAFAGAETGPEGRDRAVKP